MADTLTAAFRLEGKVPYRNININTSKSAAREKEKQYLRATCYIASHGDSVHVRIAMAEYSLLVGVDDSRILPRYERSNCDGVLSMAVLGNSRRSMTVLREHGATWE